MGGECGERGTLALEPPPSSKDSIASLREEPFVEESCRTGRGDPAGQAKERASDFTTPSASAVSYSKSRALNTCMHVHISECISVHMCMPVGVCMSGFVCVCMCMCVRTCLWGQAKGNLKWLRLSMADVEAGTVSGALGDCGDLPNTAVDRQCHLL